MSRVKDELKADIRQRFGHDADKVIDYLFDRGTLDDCLARQHVAKSRFERLYIVSTSSARQVMEDVAFDLGLTRVRVLQMLGK